VCPVRFLKYNRREREGETERCRALNMVAFTLPTTQRKKGGGTLNCESGNKWKRKAYFEV